MFTRASSKSGFKVMRFMGGEQGGYLKTRPKLAPKAMCPMPKAFSFGNIGMFRFDLRRAAKQKPTLNRSDAPPQSSLPERSGSAGRTGHRLRKVRGDFLELSIAPSPNGTLRGKPTGGLVNRQPCYPRKTASGRTRDGAICLPREAAAKSVTDPHCNRLPQMLCLC